MMANRAMVHLSQRVRHRAEGCVALGWNLASVVNDPLGAPGLPPVWVLRVVTFYIPDTRGTKMDTKIKKRSPQDFKKKRGSPSSGSLEDQV
jgi:hypothetical protein